jgi:parallel beta-helix repeat protein
MKRFTINVGIALALGLGLTLCLLALLKTAHAAPDDLFAKSDGSGAACTQANPCTLQTALSQAGDSDTIYVAQGTYTGTGTAVIDVTQSITLYGGWDGWPTGAVVRNPEQYHTTLDGENARQVVYITGDITPTLDGLRITNGSTSLGGGIRASNTQPIIRSCQIYSNTATFLGGGIHATASRPVISGCQIYSNTAQNGGGVYLTTSDNATLIGNTIYNNTTNGGNGGGVFLSESDKARMMNNMVVGNWISGTLGTGSGIQVYSSTVQLLHTTLARNSGGIGRGLYVVGGSTLTATNTILVSHTVGIVVGGGATSSAATLTATLWGTGTWANETDWIVGGTLVTGTTNIWDDPAFLGPDVGDYHIGPGSAAINQGVDAGVATDIDGDPRLGTPDIGADEYVRRVFLPLVLRAYP